MTTTTREQLKHMLWQLRHVSSTIDDAVYYSTRGIDVFRNHAVFDCAQNSAAAMAALLIGFGWPS